MRGGFTQEAHLVKFHSGSFMRIYHRMMKILHFENRAEPATLPDLFASTRFNHGTIASYQPRRDRFCPTQNDRAAYQGPLGQDGGRDLERRVQRRRNFPGGTRAIEATISG